MADYKSNRNKLPQAQLKTLTINTLSAVDQPCQEPATAVLLKRARPEGGEPVAIDKRSALTDAVQGHTHMIYGVDESQSGFTSSESMAGKEHGWHSHPWVKGEDGSITIGESESHTHVLGAGSTAKRAAEPVETGNSTAASPTPMVKVATHQEPTTMDNPEIVSLKKQLATALALAVMTDVQKAHRASLSGPDADAFDALTPAQRSAAVDVAKVADPVIYTRPNGTEIRKSQGQVVADALKEADEAMAIAKGERAARETVELHKRADTQIKHFAKSVGVRAAILKAVDGIADEKTRTEAQEALAGADAACAELAKSQGVNPGGDATGTEPVAKFNAGLAAFAKAAGKTVPQASADYVQTTEGSELYATAFPARV